MRIISILVWVGTVLIFNSCTSLDKKGNNLNKSFISYTFYEADAILDSVISSNNNPNGYFIRISQTNESRNIGIDLFVKDTLIMKDPFYRFHLQNTNRFWISKKREKIPLVFSFETKTTNLFEELTVIPGGALVEIKYNYALGRVVSSDNVH